MECYNSLMQSTATTVDDYLAEVPVERQEILRQVRALVRKELPELIESMTYGMAAYTRPVEKDAEVAFASQAQYISLYFPVSVVTAKRHLLKGLNCGKCCVRYSSVKKVDLDVVQELLQESATQYRA